MTHLSIATHRHAALCAALLVVFAGAARAQTTYNWIGGSGGFGADLFGNTGTNWSPTLTDTVNGYTGNNFSVDTQNLQGTVSSEKVLLLSGSRSIRSLNFYNIYSYNPSSNYLRINSGREGNTLFTLSFGTAGINILSVSRNTIVFSGNSGTNDLFYTKTALALNYTGQSNIHVANTFDRLYLGSGGTNDPVLGDGIDISGTGGINKTGDGSLYLDGLNTFTGGLTVSGGTVSVSSEIATGWSASGTVNPAAITLNGGMLKYTGGNGSFNANRGIQVGASGGTIEVTQAATTLGITSAIQDVSSQAGSLTKLGDGTLTLNGSVTFTGGLTISQGTVSVSSPNALGSALVSNPGAVVINGGILKFTASPTRSDANRGFRVGSSVGTIDVNSGVEVRLQGGISDVSFESGVLRKTGAGTLSVEGASNSFTGGTQLQAGTLRLNGNVLGGSGGAGLAVSTGATLAGFGTINGASSFANGSNIRPATYETSASTAVPNPSTSAVGAFTFNNSLTLGDVNLFFDLGAVNASDRITVAPGGTLNIGNGVLDLSNFTFSTLGGFGAGTYTLFSSSSSIAGTLGLARTGTLEGYSISLGLGNSGTTLDLVVISNAIPEPSAFAAIAGLGMLGFAVTRRRRRA